jgi:hypothetical protein
MPVAKGIEKVLDGQGRCVGVKVMWSDPQRGDQIYLVSDLPNTLDTAPEVEAYFNAEVSQLDDVPQTRLGAFLQCHARAKVYAFEKNVYCDFVIGISDVPFIGDPWAG